MPTIRLHDLSDSLVQTPASNRASTTLASHRASRSQNAIRSCRSRALRALLQHHDHRQSDLDIQRLVVRRPLNSSSIATRTLSPQSQECMRSSTIASSRSSRSSQRLRSFSRSSSASTCAMQLTPRAAAPLTTRYCQLAHLKCNQALHQALEPPTSLVAPPAPPCAAPHARRRIALPLPGAAHRLGPPPPLRHRLCQVHRSHAIHRCTMCASTV